MASSCEPVWHLQSLFSVLCSLSNHCSLRQKMLVAWTFRWNENQIQRMSNRMQWVWDVQKTKHDDHQQKQNFKVVSRPFYETLQYERPKSIVSKESGWKSQCKKKGEGAQKEKKKKITSYTESTRHLPHTGRLYYKWLTFWRRKKRFKCIHTCKNRSECNSFPISMTILPPILDRVIAAGETKWV